MNTTPVEKKNICPHPFFTPERIETQILQELCDLGILDEQHALLCYTDSASITIGYMDSGYMNPRHICKFESGYVSIDLYSRDRPIRFVGDITTLKQMELIHTLYSYWGALVTVLIKSITNTAPWTYTRAQENVAYWCQMKREK